MSCTEIYGFDKDGVACQIGETRNAFRGAWAVWSAMERKYLPSLPLDAWDSREGRIYKTRLGVPVYGKKEHPLQPIWDLCKNPKLDRSEAIVMMTTFDKVVVKAENIGEVIEAFNSMGFPSSLPEQAKILSERKKGYIAFAWNQSSVNCGDWWQTGELIKKDEVRGDEYGNYNILKQDEHWFLFESLDKPN